MKVDTKEILLREHTEGMERRSAVGYSRDRDFHTVIKGINPLNGNAFELPQLGWNSHSAKYDTMAKIGLVAHYGRMPALIVTADSRTVDSDAFCRQFGLAELDGSLESLAAYQRKYTEIVRAHGGDIGNLPPAVWQEAIITWMKGPDIGTSAMTSRYKRGEGDRVQWTEMHRTGESVTSKLIPDYWTKAFAAEFIVPADVLGLMKLLGAEVARRVR